MYLKIIAILIISLFVVSCGGSSKSSGSYTNEYSSKEEVKKVSDDSNQIFILSNIKEKYLSHLKEGIGLNGWKEITWVDGMNCEFLGFSDTARESQDDFEIKLFTNGNRVCRSINFSKSLYSGSKNSLFVSKDFFKQP